MLASKEVNTVFEGSTNGSCYQAKTSQDAADWEDLVRTVVN
jgi:hypothetical protein